MTFWKNKKIWSLLFGGCFSLLFISLIFLKIFLVLQIQISDVLYTEREANSNIVLIRVDDTTLKTLGPYNTWPRSYLAQALENLNKYDPKVVGFDFIYRTEKTKEEDDRLAKAFSEANSVVLGFSTDSYELSPDGYYSNSSHSPFTELPLKKFTEINSVSTGYLNFLGDTDGVIRKMIPLSYDVQVDRVYEAFPLMVVREYMDYEEDTLLNSINGNLFNYFDKYIPLEEGQILINYATSRKQHARYGYVPFSYLYNDNYPRIPDPNAFFKDKIVLIGAWDPLLGDSYLTPMDSDMEMPGVGIHASAIQTILDGNFLRYLTLFEQILLIILIVFASSFVFMYTKIRWSLVYLGVLPVIYTLLAPVFFKMGIIVDLVHPYLALITVFIATYMYRYVTEFREKNELKGAFSKYVSPTIVDQIAEHPENLKLGGEKRNVSVLFTDIAHFTTISEKLKPESLVALLNEYLEAMTDVIMAEGGTVDKYEGDAIMAFFGAPLEQKDHAIRACRVALKMRVKLEELHELWKKDPILPGGETKPILDFRCGISSGDVIVGNVGSSRRMEYTVMGDIVNLGSRLEGANKKYSTNIMVSEDTYNEAKDLFEARELDIIEVVGKSHPVRVYEILNEKGQLVDEAANLLKLYSEGIALYHERKFADALTKFEEILKIYPTDGPSKLYRQRCEVLRDFPPKDDWDGVFKMGNK